MVRRILTLFLLACALDCAAANYTDWWWNPDQSGHGLNVGQQGSTVFLSWFTYDEAGKGMWVVLSGVLDGNVVTGDFYRTTGPRLGDAFDPAAVVATKVGTGRMTFASLHSATFDWTVNGKSGSVALVRESYGQFDPTGSYVGGETDYAPAAGCPFAGTPTGNNRTTFSVSVSNGMFRMHRITEKGNTFDYTAPVKWSGQWMDLAGTYESTNAFGTGSFTGSVTMLDDALVFQFVVRPDGNPSCPGVPSVLAGTRAG